MKTLYAINKNWIFWLDRAGIYTLPIGGLVALWLVVTEDMNFLVCVSLVISASLVFSVVHHFCLYRFVVCPKCGGNLAKFKDGDKIPPKDLYNALKAGRPCIECGWVPFGDQN